MERFGSYVVLKELFSAQGARVLLARSEGAGDGGRDEFVVKVYTPVDFIGGDTYVWRREELGKGGRPRRTYDDSEAFLDGVRKQQGAREQGCRQVAPVLEYGEDHRGAWYVTRYYPHSLKKLIEGRVSLSAAGFHHVISSVVGGALGLKRSFGRSHGNLKPPNVLISTKGRVEKAEVVLTDPLPGGEHAAAEYELADVRAIGELIYQMVRRRELSGRSSWPIAESPEWAELLGKSAPAWCDLCNQLLAPDLDLDRMNLKALAVAVNRLKPGRFSPRLIGGLAAVVVVLGAGAGVLAMQHWREAGGLGRVILTSDPPGAEVYREFLPTGRVTPYEDGRVPANEEIVFGAKAEGYSMGLFSAQVESGKTVRHHFQLTRLTGVLNVSSDPPGADVYIDGAYAGRAPFTTNLPAVPEHAYRLVGRSSNLKPVERHIEITPGEFQSVPLEFPHSRLQLGSEPPGARVLLGGTNLGATPLELTLDAGPTRVLVTLPGHQPQELNLELDPDQHLRESIRLTPLNGEWILSSVPMGAVVLRDGRTIGKTPLTNQWPHGEYTLVLRYPGLEEQSVQLKVEGGSTVSREVVIPHGILRVQSQPSGAVVMDGTNVLGTTPTALVLRPGPVRLELRAEVDGIVYRGTLEGRLEVQETLVRTVNLVPEGGTHHFVSDPPGAVIFSAEGDRLGTAGEPILLPKGRLEVVARHPTYPQLEDQRLAIQVTGEPQTHRVAFPYGRLDLRSRPSGAKIFLGDEEIGQTPHVFPVMPAGRLELRLELAGYEPAEIEVEIRAGQLHSLNQRLQREGTDEGETP